MNALLLTVVLFAQLSVTVQSGIITGQLRDDSGKPLAATRIAAAELARPGNTLESSRILAAITETDSTGRYRLENIPPGRYYILAGLVDYPTYYPGVIAAKDAKIVEIAPGKVVEGLDFALAGPQGVKVRGRLVGRAVPSAVPITLFSAVASTFQTESKPDGAFEFPGVPPGAYVVRAPGFTPVNVVAGGKDVVHELTPVYSGPGVRVSGRVIGKSNGLQPGVTRTVTLIPTFVPAGVAGSPLETFVRDDGGFEFPAIPAGNYLLRSLPAAPGAASLRVEVRDQDVRGLEVAVPFQIETAGRVLLDGHGFNDMAIVESHQGNFTTASSIRADGTFRLRLTEGDNQIGVARLSAEFAVASITYGSMDITRVPLRIDSDAVPQEIVVTVERVVSSTPGTLVGTNIAGVDLISSPRVDVGGRVSVVDAQGRVRPIIPANLSVSFKRPDTSWGAAILPDGTFGISLLEELYMVSVNNVVSPYTIKSISSGSTNLVKEPLEVSSRKMPASIEVILEYTPAVR